MYVSSGQLAFSTSGTLRGYFATNGHFTIPSGNVAISGGSVVSGIANFMHQTSIALNNGAAAAAGTLTNAPVAGNPTKWIPINDGGTTRYIPAW
jgi:hypothetical protein